LLFYGETRVGADTSYNLIQIRALNLTFNSGFVVTAITSYDDTEWAYLSTTTNYSPAYTPLYDWSPATKKYVDDAIAWAGWDVLVSDQANNILTSWMKIWAGTQVNYEALGTYDNNTVYLTI
jgi:hypothetical protein